MKLLLHEKRHLSRIKVEVAVVNLANMVSITKQYQIEDNQVYLETRERYQITVSKNMSEFGNTCGELYQFSFPELFFAQCNTPKIEWTALFEKAIEGRFLKIQSRIGKKTKIDPRNKAVSAPQVTFLMTSIFSDDALLLNFEPFDFVSTRDYWWEKEQKYFLHVVRSRNRWNYHKHFNLRILNFAFSGIL